MSTHANAAHNNPVTSAEQHVEGHAEAVHEEGQAHGSMRSYLTGFLLSVVLTAIPFWLVMTGTLSTQLTAVIVVGMAVVQIVVHMVFFLHMDPRSEEGWNIMALGFTLIVVVIVLSGSLWVMYHLNSNMMPDMEMSQLLQ